MLSVTGIYDGKNVRLLTDINESRKYKVIVTFVEELENTVTDETEIRNFGTSHASLEFWDDPKEDIYQDYITEQNDK